MRVVVICEGKTEVTLRPAWTKLVQRRRLTKATAAIKTRAMRGPVCQPKLVRVVGELGAKSDVAGIIVLTDVYPASSAQEVMGKINRLVAEAAPKAPCRTHVAQFDVEAWAMPFWDEIAASLGFEASRPRAKPEDINHKNPPSKRLRALYRRAGYAYDKVRDGRKWLTADRLERAAKDCPQLKDFLNSLLEFAGAEKLK
ncbi:MAG: DUF4276 family protein [Planctomycetes bacterium]|nr:DUF4276 family protein [Planctomycetota bacterium]